MRQMTIREFEALVAKGEAVLDRNPPFPVDFPVYRLPDGSRAVRTEKKVMIFEPDDDEGGARGAVPPPPRPEDLLAPGFLERVNEAREHIWERLGVRHVPVKGIPSVAELAQLDRAMRKRKGPVECELLESLVAVLGEALRGQDGQWTPRETPGGGTMPIVVVKGQEWYPLNETIEQLDNQKEFTFAGIVKYAALKRKKKGLFGP
jgi:hypothetical protein